MKGDMLIFDDSQKDEFIEIFKTPPIPPTEFKKIRKRQANAYFLVNTSPWTDCFCADNLLYEHTHLSAPRRGAQERKPPRQETGPSPANLEGTR